MPNENCLKGIRCPKCGHTDDFYIVGQSTFHTMDDGTEGHTDVEWDDDSSCRCGNSDCEFVGDLRDFQKMNAEEEERLVKQLLQDCYNDEGFLRDVIACYVAERYDLASYQDYFKDLDSDPEEAP
jgi:hypothetical protein